jgi:hypothetical protein
VTGGLPVGAIPRPDTVQSRFAACRRGSVDWSTRPTAPARPRHPLAVQPIAPPPRRVPPPVPSGLVARVAAVVDEWAAGRSALVRAPLLVFLAYVGVRQFLDPEEYASILAPINLGIHEAGHFVWRPFGLFLMVLGGTLTQCLAPVAAFWIFARQRDFFAMAVAVAWLSTNFVHVGNYMADAEAMARPLVTVGAGEPAVAHDWRFLFERLDVLHRCEAIGAATRGLGHATMAIALAAGAWVLVRMWTLRAPLTRGGGSSPR